MARGFESALGVTTRSNVDHQAAAAQRLRELAGPGRGENLHEVTEVIVIASSSRGGSSVLAETLRACPELVSLQGELTPLLRAAEIDRQESPSDSDELVRCSEEKLVALEAQLRFDIGGPRGSLRRPEVFELFVDRLQWRLTAQWPHLDIARADVHAALDHASSAHSMLEGPAGSGLTALRDFHVSFLTALRRTHPAIRLAAYDLQRGPVDSAALPMPPTRDLVEEPPFITISPNAPTAWAVLRDRALVIKSPSNAFRLSFLRWVFPRARLRLLHLVRHPRASIAGLTDGWLYPGFHSHFLEDRLDIAGYRERFPDHARHWWKFDLPPGWEACADRHLVDVASFQWEQTHRHTLKDAPRFCDEYVRVRFEDLLEGGAAARGLGEWLGLGDPDAVGRHLRAAPRVMATRAHQRRRSTLFAEHVARCVVQPSIRELATELGYADA